MHLLIRAWNDVQQSTITKAFQHAGFSTIIEERESQENVPCNISEDELRPVHSNANLRHANLRQLSPPIRKPFFPEERASNPRKSFLIGGRN